MGGFALQKERNYAIQTNIRRWGNSQGIRLPKEILSQLNLQENDAVGINGTPKGNEELIIHFM